MALDSGLVGHKNCVTCDRVEEIGADIQAELNGKTFASCSFKRKNQKLQSRACILMSKLIPKVSPLIH